MDAADASASEGVMVAFLPTTTDWCRQELPHMTLVYAGLKTDLTPSDFSALAKDTASLSMLTRPFVLSVFSIEVFGDVDKVNVLRFRNTPELMAMRRYVEPWNKSQHPFNPHATIGPTSLNSMGPMPSVVGFDRIMLGWGEEQLTFWLNNKY